MTDWVAYFAEEERRAALLAGMVPAEAAPARPPAAQAQWGDHMLNELQSRFPRKD